MEQQTNEQVNSHVGSKLSITFWIIAFIITAFTAYYQRVTGPSYPLSGSASFQGKDIFINLNKAAAVMKIARSK
jgi:hypothetical protein